MLLGMALFAKCRFHTLTPCKAFRQKIRKDALEQYSVTDEEAFKKNLKLGREIADFLRRNIVQAERLHMQPGEENTDTYSTYRLLFFFRIARGFYLV